jgi:hypothetical protein
MPTFIVEDGTGLASATSYITEAEADNLVLPSATWLTYTQAEKEEALMVATEYFDVRYCGKIKGSPLTETQRLLFPREDVYIKNCDTAEDPVPDILKSAIAELARVYRDRGSLFNTPLREGVPSGEVIKTVDTVGPLREERVYNDGTGNSSNTPWPSFPKADNMIKQLLVSNFGNSCKVVR